MMLMKLKCAAILYFLTTTLLSCAQPSTKENTVGLAGGIELSIGAEKFSRAIASADVQILDVRTATEFNTGHIPKALQANWLDQKEFLKRTQSLEKSKIIYIYCQSGGRSASAQEALMQAGYQVVNLEGGMRNWLMQDLPVERIGTIEQMGVVDFKKVIKSNAYVLVDIGAKWCPPCRKMQPVLDALKNNPPKPFYFLGVDGGQDLEVMQSIQVIELPTYILFKNGKEVWRKVGVTPKEAFEKALEL